MSNGGSSVLDYSIEMDDNNDGVYSQVATGVTSTSHIETSLTSGNTYAFRVRARNAINFSNYSAVFSIVAATVPSQPSAPTTTLSGDKTSVIIDWNPPSDLGGLTTDGYKLEIKTQSGTFEKDLTNCDAETNATIQSATSCTVPITTLRASPFNLVDSDSIYARVTAFNAIGNSAVSQEGNGAKIAGDAPGVPLNLRRSDVITPQDTSIALDWDAPTFEGTSSITGYSVYWN